jgi:hypothetical protein
MAFLIGNVLLSPAYVIIVATWYGEAMVRNPLDHALWAGVILAFIPVQIMYRFLVCAVMAVIHAAQRQKEPVDLEDEMDKAIDRKATVFTSNTVLISLVAALGTQVLGLPLMDLFLVVGAGIVLAGIIGDLAMMLFYRRGV